MKNHNTTETDLWFAAYNTKTEVVIKTGIYGQRAQNINDGRITQAIKIALQYAKTPSHLTSSTFSSSVLAMMSTS